MSNISSEGLKTLRSKVLGEVNLGNKRTHPISLDFTDIDPKFQGIVVVHYPSQLERMQMGVLKSKLLDGNLNVDVATYNLALIISTLDFVIESKPEWFNVDDPEFEYDILEAVFLEYTQWESSFRNRGKEGQPSGNSQDSGSQV